MGPKLKDEGFVQNKQSSRSFSS